VTTIDIKFVYMASRLFQWLFHKLCNLVFKQVDYNNDGKLEPLEIEIAVLKMYNIINKRLPGWQNPPSRAKIRETLKLFDEDGNGSLDKDVRSAALSCTLAEAAGLLYGSKQSCCEQ
jgi:hypothetical protein